MDIAFWTQRWSEGRIGFHEGRANQYLARHIRVLEGRRVLVPLCGKSEDLAFLAAAGHDVVGVEAVEDAVKAFYEEHKLKPSIREGKGVRIYSAASVTLIAGDFFATTKEDVGPVDGYYDRAALIALPPDLRPRYITHTRSLLSAGARGLLVSFEYPDGLVSAPPHSVAVPEIHALYTGATLAEVDGGPADGRHKGAHERCFAIDF